MQKKMLSILFGMLLAIPACTEAYFNSATLYATREAKIPNFKLPNAWLIDGSNIYATKKNPGEYPILNYYHRGAVRIAEQYAQEFAFKPVDLKNLLDKDKFLIDMEQHDVRTRNWRFGIYTIARDGDTWVCVRTSWSYDIFSKTDSPIIRRISITKDGVTRDYLGLGYDLNNLKYVKENPEKVEKYLSEQSSKPRFYSEYFLDDCKDAVKYLDEAVVNKPFDKEIMIKEYKYKANSTTGKHEKYVKHYFKGDRLFLVNRRTLLFNNDYNTWYFIKGYTDEFNIDDLIAKYDHN